MNKLAGKITVIMLFIAACAQVASARTVPVKSVVYEKNSRCERIVITVTGDITWKSAVLGKSAVSDSYRLYIDIFGSQPARKARKPARPASPLIRNIRVAPRDTETTRVVLDLAAPLNKNDYTVSRSSDSSRLVLEIPRTAALPLKPTPAPPTARQGSSAPKQPTASAHRPAAKKQSGLHAPPLTAKADAAPTLDDLHPRFIVIDPGHGGKDPGATGYKGVKEKDISLAIAFEVKKILDADKRCRTVMTRTTDSFISLEERAAIANNNRADLFISIHANAHTDPRLRGTETYYLDFSSDDDARRVAARENLTTPEAIGDLELILFDLLQGDKINQSSILAGHVHTALMRSLKAKYPDTRNLGVKHAPMKVLVDAEMPCLILETAFLSNPVEARRLQKPDHQRLLARAITEGIDSFLRGESKTAAAASSRAEM